MKKRVVDWIADYLEKEGVEYYFGYNGHSNWAILDALARKTKIKGIQPRHESMAVQMADLYYRTKHKIAPVIVTGGPGAFNALSAIPNLIHESSATVLISGTTSTTQFDKGGLQEIYYQGPEDFMRCIQPVVKKAWFVVNPQRAIDAINKAFVVAGSMRPGPTFVYLPIDVQHAEIEIEELPESTRHRPEGRVRGDSKAVFHAAQLISTARRPLLLAGGGVLLSEATGELKELAETFNIPVATSVIIGDSAFPEDHALAVGPVGRVGWHSAILAVREADVLIAVGNRFTDQETGGWIDPKNDASIFRIPPTKLVQIDIESNEIGRNYPVEVGIVGDAKLVLRDLIDALIPKMKKKPENDPWLRTVLKNKAAWEEKIKPDVTSNRTPIHPARLVHDIRESLPSDAITVVDISHVFLFNELYSKVPTPATCFSNTGFAQMGWAVGGVLGAKLAHPDRVCICLCGDGGFVMENYAVATAVEYDIPVIWVILNNYGHNICVHGQKNMYGLAPWTDFKKTETGELYNPDFVQWAEACGAQGERIVDPHEIKSAAKRAIKANKPYIIDAIVDRDFCAPSAPGFTLELWFGKKKKLN